jgi:hypothetical protein
MEHLSKLFGSPARVKLLRLFVFNPDCVYDRDSVITSARVTPDTASKELAALARAGIISRKTFYKEVPRPGSKEVKKRKTIGWQFNQKYPYLEALNRFLRDTLVVSHTDIKKRLRGVGTLKYLVLAGFLIGDKDRGIDMLIVGTKVGDKALQNAVGMLEAECGQEIRYAVLSVDDYLFRRRVRDKLVRDIVDFPHVVVVDKLVRHT